MSSTVAAVLVSMLLLDLVKVHRPSSAAPIWARRWHDHPPDDDRRPAGRTAWRAVRLVTAAALMGVTVTLLSGCAARAPAAPRALSPSLPVLHVAAVVVRPQALPDAPGLLARSWFHQSVELQATATTRRLAIGHQLASELAELDGAPTLSGTVEVPLALPPGIVGSRAAFRSGTLARARLEIVAADGRTLASATESIGWDDVRWTRGGPKLRRARLPDEALGDAVDRVLERAVRRLAAQLESDVEREAAGSRRWLALGH